MKIRIFVVVALGVLCTPRPARACQYCMQYGLASESLPVEAPQPTRDGPADITQYPRLEPQDMAFILSQENGRYVQVGVNLADKKIRDPWKRLLKTAAVLELLRPLGERAVKGLREKAKADTLTPEDLKLGSHHYGDLGDLYNEADRAFLRELSDRWLKIVAPKPESI